MYVCMYGVYKYRRVKSYVYYVFEEKKNSGNFIARE